MKKSNVFLLFNVILFLGVIVGFFMAHVKCSVNFERDNQIDIPK